MDMLRHDRDVLVAYWIICAQVVCATSSEDSLIYIDKFGDCFKVFL